MKNSIPLKQRKQELFTIIRKTKDGTPTTLEVNIATPHSQHVIENIKRADPRMLRASLVDPLANGTLMI